MISCFARIALMLSVVTAFCATARADDWLYFRGANHDGKSKETGWQSVWPEAGPKIAWRKNVGVGASSVVVKGKQVITMGNENDKDVVTCLDADTGNVVWTFDYPCAFERRMFDGGTASTPTIDDDRVYTFSHNGDLHCLTLADGKVVWKKQVVNEFGGRTSRWKYACSPLVMGEILYVDIGGSYSTIALNKMNGSPFWGSGDEAAGYASPIPFKRGDETGVLVFKGSDLVAYNAKDGQQWWNIPWSPRTGVNATSPIVLANHRVFISSGYGMGGAMYDVSTDAPRQLWKNDELTTKTSQVIHHDGYLYATSERGQVLCVSAADGKTAWSQRDLGGGTLAFAADKLIILSGRGELAVADATPRQFNAVSRAQIIQGPDTCWVVPVLAHGRIYCRSNRGQLVSVDVRASQ